MNAIRSVRAQPPAIFSSSLQYSLGHKSSVISFRPVVTSSSRHPESMDQKEKNPNEKSGDVMSHSFGEGYATRSNEEGFGGNESINDIKTDNKIHENHPAYDKTQGGEVKEKEKARNQTNASS
ncbi:hypothetical protein CRYUN_Cryun15aG0134100 [Craigia yunnanensis]